MSMLGRGMGGGSAEVGETVASFAQYEAAQKAVSKLISAEVPAKQIAIVGLGLRSVERVTGRLGYASAARSGALNGLVIGVLFSFIFLLGTPGAPAQAFIGVLLVGVAIGMLLSLIMYSFVRRRRDYASVTQVVADHYEVTVLATSAHRARAALGGGVEPAPAAESAPAAPPAPPGDGEDPPAPPAVAPPRYGERIEPSVAPTVDPGADASGEDRERA